MKLFNNFYNMKVGIVDLSESSSEVAPLDDQLVSEKIGGAAVNADLFNRYKDDDPLILGVGPLTGSFAPASCLSVATFLSPRFGNLCHVPFMLRTGPEMKFSGIDFLVIKGSASSPKILHLDKGAIQVLSAEYLAGLEIPEAVQTLKKEISHPRSIILTGPAADHGVSCASVSTGMRGSLDKAGLAFQMASKNLKGIIFNGTGGLPFSHDNLAMGRKMVEDIVFFDRFKKEGFITILDRIGVESEAKKIIVKSKKKDLACYNCPFPCMSYVEFKWRDPRLKGNPKIKEGTFLLDHTGFAAMVRKRQADALVLMKECLNLGLDTSAVAELLPQEGTLETSLDFISDMAKADDENQVADNLYQGHIPLDKYVLFGSGIPRISPGDAEVDSSFWGKRVAMSMILGVCPILMLLFPNINIANLLKFITAKNNDLESLQTIISSRIQSILMD